ncbi:MAG: DMT family transporter [Actinomycetota bacterium]|nr:DMT family transporter [Actinomycetota bacterium]
MSRAYFPLLTVLALLWGASYLFIKVGVREFEPATMMLTRVAIASVVLLLYLWRSGLLGELRRAGWQAYALGIFNGAIPFTLIAWGEQHVDSGVAAIANSTVPIFVILLAAAFRPDERPSGLRLAGVLLGLVGVVVLAGVHPDGGWWAVGGTLAVVVASASYGSAVLWGKDLMAGVRGPVLATTGVLGAFVALLPFGLAQAPGHLPSWKPLASVVALAVLGTALAMLVWFRLLAAGGATRSSLVTYLLPVTALLYGAVFLDESITAQKIGGLLLILAGVAVGSGAVRFGREAPAPVRP